MNNHEKGMTLIEVLAAITITAFLIGTATLLLTQISASWRQSVHDYTGDARSSRALNALGEALEDAYEGYYRSYDTSEGTVQEVRLWNGVPDGRNPGPSYRAYRYIPASRSLIVHTIASSDSTTYRSAVLDQGRVLADHVTSFEMYLVTVNADGTETASRLSTTAEIPPGAVINVQLTVAYTKANARGPDTNYPERRFEGQYRLLSY